MTYSPRRVKHDVLALLNSTEAISSNDSQYGASLLLLAAACLATSRDSLLERAAFAFDSVPTTWRVNLEE